jgi:HlyD family secretion protein
MRSNIFLCFILLSLPSCSQPTEVKLVRAERRDVESIVTSVNAGTVKAEKSAELAFGAVGRVQSLSVTLGQRVKAGQILATIENTDLVTGLQRAETEYKRRISLKTGQLSQSEIDLAKQSVDTAQMQLERTRIRAPYDGIIAELNMEIGQLSQITAIIPKAPIRIVDLSPRYIRAQIDEADLPKVKNGMPARVKILAVRKEPFEGVLRKVVPYVSNIREQDRTAEIEVDVKTDQVLPAGASADVEIIVERKADTLALPARSVFGRAQDKYVYADDSGEAKQLFVKTGLSNFDVVEILEGLNEGQLVIQPTDRSAIADGVKIRVIK